ncbi:hypothetical protein ACJVDH_09825 [Pedobacter sp. AW1-32]|uniref:hypothetical protein n=1 Tax=Pedobacter sp. AW1-32 TaxID=3383026 RepID=UPI003FEF7F75
MNNSKPEIRAYHDFLTKRMSKDEKIKMPHLALFAGLIICWTQEGRTNTFSITRKTLMSFSKISSIATYHKCIKELDQLGYIIYQPSFHPRKGSMVTWGNRTK